MTIAPLDGILHAPLLYISLQRILGSDRIRRICLDRLVKLREGERVLDIGCGPGHPPVDYVGFDTEPRYIAYAKKHYSDRGRFFCERLGRAHVTKFQPFDAIMLFGILHHVDNAEADDLLGLLAQCLAPGGRVVTIDPCFVAGQASATRLIARWDRGRFVRTESGYRDLVAKYFNKLETSLITGRMPSIELDHASRYPRGAQPRCRDQ
ncbi:MAG TPA: class I SAM-dependent methyltransferase [Xanthobacteraceae bacterium]|jgi:SAM-dependent methyltransferase